MNRLSAWNPPRRLTEDPLQRVEQATPYPSTRWGLVNALIAYVVLWRGLDWAVWKKLLLLPGIVLFSAWTAPTTRSTGVLITAAICNVDLVDNLTFLHNRVEDVLIAPHTHAAALGDFGILQITSNGGGGPAYFSWVAPDDFSALAEAAIVFEANYTAPDTFTVTTDFGAAGEGHANHSDSVTSSATWTNNVITEYNILDAFTGLAAGDYVGVAFAVSGGGGGGELIQVIGLRLRWSRT
ncbi:MAG TPA: hypothetical protein VIV12_21130 [Streptosporangiaceae bacterium]